jgi:hypothetical protein
MSCPEHLISQLGRQGVGIIQPQSGLDYPLVAPSEDIRYLIADFHLSLENDVSGLAPFYISNLYGVGCVENEPAEGFITPVHAADILVRGTGDEIVFDSSDADTEFETKDWSDNYRLYNWKNEKGVCNLLVYTSWADTDSSQRFYDKYLTPQNGTLDARAVYVLPLRLLSISVGTAAASSKMTGKINFVNGYNTTITTAAPTIADFIVNTAVTIGAAAGSGKGKYSTCGDDPAPTIFPIKKINGIPAPTGDFLLAAADCLYARRPTSKVGDDIVPDNYLEIGAVCDACCKCDDYVELAQQVNQYRNQYAYIGARVNEVKNIHEQNIQKWIDERACGLDNPLRVLLVAQRCPYMDVVLLVCNPCSDCLYAKELKIELEPAEGVTSHAEVVRGYTALFSATSNGRPVVITREILGRKTILTVPFATVKNGDAAYVRFRVKFSAKSEYAVTGTLSGTLIDNTPILTGCITPDNQTERLAAQATATQALYCDNNGETTMP